MSKIQTVISDEWGEIAQFSIAGEAEVEAGIRYVFSSSSDKPHVIVVVADSSNAIRDVKVNGETLEPVNTETRTFISRVVQPDRDAEVVISLNPNVPGASVYAGFFERWGKPIRGGFHKAVSKFWNECFACKALVRMAISVVTGGADLTGEALDQAFEAAEDQLDDYIGDTLLAEIIDVVRDAMNPGRLVAREVCLRLGYCT
ncbi:MAG TPA: saposin domain-containing protein [Pyrinomonadaceae bacterium]|nr:saposin domain-containing protein [Pyrinomonadaceae bacterium]